MEITPDTKVAQFDWSTWVPAQRATLLFVIRDGRILLIHKKRGLGAGKINGPGGRIEPGETPRQAAVREIREELLTTPLDVHKSGELSFLFLDGLSLHVHVFRAGGLSDPPAETDEAVPVWAPLDGIPFHRMWEDDVFWFPHLLTGTPFRGRFLFDRDRLLDREVTAPAGPDELSPAKT